MAMYNFNDTTRGTVAAKSSAETLAICQLTGTGHIDPVFVDNAIAGFTTLYTTGRDIPPVEIVESDVGELSDGAILRGTKYGPRDIVVGFSLESSSASDYRSKITALNSLLKGELLIAFRDDLTLTDVYYEGYYYKAVFAGGSEIEGGHLNGKGELTFHCSDPIRYSSAFTTIDFDASAGEAQEFESVGQLPAYPIINIDPGAKGKMTFVNEKTRASITIGTDGESASQAKLTTTPPTLSGNPTPTFTKLSEGYSGIDYYDIEPDVSGETIKYQSGTGMFPEYDALSQSTDNAVGPGIMYNSTVNAADCGWALYDVNLSVPDNYKHQQNLLFQVQGTSTGSPKSAIYIFNTKSNPGIFVYLYTGTGYQTTVAIPRGKYMFSMRYIGNTVTFRCVSATTGESYINRSYYIDNLGSTAGQYAFLQFYRSAAFSDPGGEDKSISIGKMAWYGTAGYTENDLVQIDTGTGSVLVNGTPRPDLGDIRNDFENFYIDGPTNITWSSTSESCDPTIYLRWRERYL